MGRGAGLRRRLGLNGSGLPALLVATLVGAGCGVGGEAPLDIDAVERQIPTVLLPGHPDLVTEVDCGSPDPEGLGPLSCTALVADTPVPVHVNRPGIDGRVRVRSPIEVVVAVDLAARVAERLRGDTGVDARVACSPSVRVAFPGESFACMATDPDGREIALVATLLGAAGGFRLDADLRLPVAEGSTVEEPSP